jgi:hypothetical protein
MMTPDEETPLLAQENRKPEPTRMPWSQISLLLVLQLLGPLTAQIISPFAPEVRLRADTSCDSGVD